MKKLLCIILAVLMLSGLCLVSSAEKTEVKEANTSDANLPGIFSTLDVKEAIAKKEARKSGLTIQTVNEDDVKTSLGFIAELPDENDIKVASTFTISDDVLADILEYSGFTRMSGNKFYTEEAEYVTSMNLDGYDVESLSGLQNFTNLEMLSFNYCLVESISPLKSLKKLTYLSFEGNYVTSISDLSGLTNLEYLNVGYNELKSISAISGLKNLKILIASLNPGVTALPTMTNLKNLELIDVSYNSLTSCSKLSGLSNLQVIGLDCNKLSGSFPSLSNMNNLTDLHIGFNDITSISNVSKLTKLEVLDISCNAIEDISAVSKLSDLLIFRAFSNKIADITPLSSLKKLRAIFIASPDLTEEELESLEAMGANIKNINNKNLVADILCLQNCKDLMLLDIYGNGIGDFTPLLSIEMLTFVNIENNYVDTQDANNQVYLEELQYRTGIASEEALEDWEVPFFEELVARGFISTENEGDSLYEAYEEPVFGEQQVAYRPVTEPKIEYSEEGAVLTWTAAQELSSPARTITGYQILRGDREIGPYEIVGTVNSKDITTFIDKTVEADKMYLYKIRAYNTVSNNTYTSACTAPMNYTHTAPEPVYSLGDLTGDGEVTSEDALLTLKASVGIVELTEKQAPFADVNGDGEITSEDALLVLKYSVGIIDKFPVEPIEPIKVGFAQVGHESDWRTAATKSAFEVFSEENGYELSYVDCDNNAAEQIGAVRNFIEQDVDYIIIDPIISFGWSTVLTECEEAGIPVIVVDRTIDDSDKYISWVGNNFYTEGLAAGEWLKAYAKAKNIKEINALVLQGSPNTSATVGRTDGFKEVADREGWTILDSQNANSTEAGAHEVMESLCKRFRGQFNVVICQNDNMAYGAMTAMGHAGLSYGKDGGTIVVSFGASPLALESVLDGDISADIECSSVFAPSVDAIIKQLENGESVEKEIYIPESLFISDDILGDYITVNGERQPITVVTQEVIDNQYRLYDYDYDHSDATNPRPLDPENPVRVGFVQSGHESDWRVASTRAIFDTFTEENGYDLVFVDCDNNVAIQHEAIRNYTYMKLDYIIVSPIISTGWDEVLTECEEAGIPVIVVDRTIDDSDKYISWVGNNFYTEGLAAGEWLKAYAKAKGITEINALVIEGSASTSATIGRTNGFAEIAEREGWNILDSQCGDFTAVGGQEVMESLCMSYKNRFNVVICQNDSMAYGAMEALDDAGVTYGKDGDVILVSFDAGIAGLEFVFRGAVNANIECNPVFVPTVDLIIRQLEYGESVEREAYIPDTIFIAEDIGREFVLVNDEFMSLKTVTQEVLNSRLY